MDTPNLAAVKAAFELWYASLPPMIHKMGANDPDVKELARAAFLSGVIHGTDFALCVIKSKFPEMGL